MLARIYEFVSTQPKPVIAGMILLGCFFAWSCLFILLRYLSAYRKLTNAERLQMIEAGQSSELIKSFDGQASRNRFLAVALALGGFVPCAAIGGATWVTIRTDDQFAICLVAWICAVTAALVSTICATIIVLRQCRSV